MPIFARAKLLIHDYCLFPLHRATLEFSGPNPQNAVEQSKKLLFQIWNVVEKEFQEREFKWDRTTAKEDFHLRWEIIKDLDTFSFYHVTIDIDGFAKPSKEFGKEGSVKIVIEPRLRTEYPQETVWQRSLPYELFRVLYHKLVYESQRKKYLEECRIMMTNFNDGIRAFFNILSKG
jgi:hypothetical protein